MKFGTTCDGLKLLWFTIENIAYKYTDLEIRYDNDKVTLTYKLNFHKLPFDYGYGISVLECDGT